MLCTGGPPGNVGLEEEGGLLILSFFGFISNKQLSFALYKTLDVDNVFGLLGTKTTFPALTCAGCIWWAASGGQGTWPGTWTLLPWDVRSGWFQLVWRFSGLVYLELEICYMGILIRQTRLLWLFWPWCWSYKFATVNVDPGEPDGEGQDWYHAAPGGGAHRGQHLCDWIHSGVSWNFVF